jgi:hypothetical protein
MRERGVTIDVRVDPVAMPSRCRREDSSTEMLGNLLRQCLQMGGKFAAVSRSQRRAQRFSNE